MCGIVGYVGKKPVVPVIIEGLRKLEYRGYDSAGIAVCGNGEGLQVRRAEGKLRNLDEVIRQHPLDGYPEFIGKALDEGEILYRIFIAAMWQIVHKCRECWKAMACFRY